MASTRRKLLRRLATVVTVAAVATAGFMVVAGGEGSPDGSADGAAGSTPADPTGPVADPTSIRTDVSEVALATRPSRHVGPQGRVGQFVATCDYSHSGPHDPIVYPTAPGAAAGEDHDHGSAHAQPEGGHAHGDGGSHRHDFFGADAIDSASTPESLLAGGTTCDKVADKAGYWHPTLYNHGEIVVPLDLVAYYRPAPGVDAALVETIPFGLALIAGDASATGPQSTGAAGWTCGIRAIVADEPPICPVSAPLSMTLVFQDCWDGEHLRAVDHQSHVAYSTEGACPPSHPVHIPQVMVLVRFPIDGDGHDLTLASGPVHTVHGDFLNAWEPDGLWREIEGCIHREVVCNLGSNRREDPLFRHS